MSGHRCDVPRCDGTRLGHDLAVEFPEETARFDAAMDDLRASHPRAAKAAATYVDPTLPHQVVLICTQRAQHIVVSCNCLATRHRNRTVSHEPIAEVSTYDETVELFNNPDFHATWFDPEVHGLRPWWHRWGSEAAARAGVPA